ncbi:MAG: HlyD family type I secretion periplasmic adaptor subunit [Nitrosomonadales bacterium]|nr:HlyD family type I secretion periplasmic adaptor subunit [Nitrosomonadales bacterium]
MDAPKPHQPYRDSAFDRGRSLAETCFSRSLLYAVLSFLLLAAIWAHYAILDEVTSGTGKVIPSSQVQVIQNLEGGILSELSAHEGDVVSKDQVLLRIDDTKFVSNYKEGRARYLALLAANARLLAETTGEKPVFSKELRDEAPQSVKAESALFDSKMKALDASIGSVYRSYQLAKEELDKTMPLLQKGSASEVEILRLQRQVNDLRGQVDDQRNKFRAEAQSELNKNLLEIEGLAQTNISSADRMTRTVVRSPVQGVIKKLYVVTIGGIIQPGMSIMDIVPIEDNLLIEAQVRPSDIAFLHPGQDATVKITAYDFSIYGGIRGKLEHISADTIVDEKRGESYFLIRVRTDTNFVQSGSKQLPIIPGMTADVEILTGRKSILSYLLKPLLKAKEKALRER